MKFWEFTKVKGTKIKINHWLSDTMGLMDEGCVYSTLFKYTADGPKDCEIILSMFPQENYRTLTHITFYMKDVPGSSAQASMFLADREINILNSISLNGISDTVIIWKLMADLSFAGEADLLIENLAQRKSAGDPSVSLIDHISTKPAEIGRMFRSDLESHTKEEVRRAEPCTFEGGTFDIAPEYDDILIDIDGRDVMIVADADSWIMSITFFKPNTQLINLVFEIPDNPGSLQQTFDLLARRNINLISVFSKVKICYQRMILEVVADIGHISTSAEEFRETLPQELKELNGIFSLKELKELS
ncbi:MAG TPA: ACT domain protein [Candidatus Methanomethylophilaceae archaeon]|nr:ACT domain protein [Candidatus Methanomethylophilaceae archaeon]